MRSINRAALLVRPKEPYLQWAASLDDEAPAMAESIKGKTSIYLVAEDPTGREESAPIKRYFKDIFDHELEMWHTDEADWPKHRDLKMFHEWFDVEAKSLVWDMEPSPIEIDED